MDVAHRYYQQEQSFFSQPDHRRTRAPLYFETDVQTGEPMPTLKYDKQLRPRESQLPLQAGPSRYETNEQPNIFFRKQIEPAAEPTTTKSLLSLRKIHKPEGGIRVYFFGGQQYRQYDRSDIHQLIRVSKFIAHAVQDYCHFFLGLVPQRLSHSSFELKLADFNNGHDSLIQPLDYSDEIFPYFGQNLCLVRKDDNRSGHLQSFQSAIKDNCEVIEVIVPSHNNTTLKIKIEPQKRFDYLLERVFKMCDITDSPNDYVLIEYNTFKVHQPATTVAEMKERHFQLLRSKPKSYDDMSEHPQHHVPSRADSRASFLGASALEFNLHVEGKTVSRICSSICVEVERALWQEKLRLSIEDGHLVERYERGFISKFMQMVCQQEYEKRYPLITLVSIFGEDDCLVLRFLNRKSSVIRRYCVSEPHRGAFLNEILRLCRMNGKLLTVPERFSR